MSARLVGAGAGFLAQILLARLLGPADLGLWYLVTSAAILLGSLAAFAWGGLASRLVTRYRLRGDTGALAGFAGRAWREALGLGLLAALGMAAVATLLGAPPLLAATGAAAIPAFALMRVDGGLANALGRNALAFLPDTTLRPLLFCAILAAAALAGATPGPLEALTLFTGLAVALAAGQAILVLRALARVAPGLGPVALWRARPDRRRLSRWRASGARLVVPLVAGALLADVAILVAGTSLGAAEVGLFGAAVKLAFLVGFATQVAHQVAAPRFAAAIARRDMHALAREITRVNAVTVCATAAGALALVLFGRQALALFGPGFAEAHGALVALALAQVARAAAGPALPVLAGAGRQGASLAPNLAMLAVTAAGILALAPALGPTGAGLAVLAGTLACGIWLAVRVPRLLGVRVDALASAGALLSAAYSAGAGRGGAGRGARRGSRKARA
ncbi:MAG: lipopolysaccharide biosynthesis protein [Salinarimonas sp.]